MIKIRRVRPHLHELVNDTRFMETIYLAPHAMQDHMPFNFELVYDSYGPRQKNCENPIDYYEQSTRIPAILSWLEAGT